MKKLIIGLVMLGLASSGSLRAQDSTQVGEDQIEINVDGARIILDKADLENLTEGGQLVDELISQIMSAVEKIEENGDVNMSFKFNEDTIFFGGLNEGLAEWKEEMAEWQEEMKAWQEEMALNNFETREGTDSLGNKKIIITKDGVEYEYPAEPNGNWFEFNWETPEVPEVPEFGETPEAPEAPEAPAFGRFHDYDNAFSHRHDHEDDDDEEENDRAGKFGETFESFQVRAGFTNYLNSNNQLPAESRDNHALNTVRSNIFSFGTAYKTRLAGPLFLKYGLELSFQDYFLEGEYVIRNAGGQTTYDPIDPAEIRSLDKSKLKTTFVNAPVMLTLISGDPEDEDEFTLGFGGYVGYMLGAKSKLKYEDTNGDNQKVKRRGSFNLNEFQYGLQAQIGVKGVNLFARYAVSEFFDGGAGVSGLNGMSFGIVF